MKNKLLLFVFLLTFVILSGCGSSNEKAGSSGTAQPTATQEAEPSTSPAAKSSPEPQQAKKLNDAEQMALDYITIYLNGSDLDAKKKYVDDNIHPDTQHIFKILESSETPAENKFLNPQVSDSVEFESSGKQMTATLITGEKNGEKIEMIVLCADKKMAMPMMPSVDDPKVQKAYEDMRARFK